MSQLKDFLALRRDVLYRVDGTYHERDWFLFNRASYAETEPEKIMMLVPAIWLAEAKAVQNFNDRVKRGGIRKLEQQNSLEFLNPWSASSPPTRPDWWGGD